MLVIHILLRSIVSFYFQGQAYIFVIVTDLDFEYNLDDKVDSILVSIQPSSLMQYSTYKTYAGTFGYGSLTARYRVDCDDHFFRDGMGSCKL